MKPLRTFPRDQARQVKFVCCDIDDTLTTEGRLSSAAYDALWRLHDDGIQVVPVTGRPAGWCDLISRQWPVAAVLGENGAFAMYLDRSGHQQTLFNSHAPEPHATRDRLQRIASEIYKRIPGTRPAKDQFSRLFDVAIDFREEEPFLGLEQAEAIRDHFEAHGARAKVSSIHVNAWFGDYDKLSMAAEYFRSIHGVEMSEPGANRSVVFAGDSPNDEPMFGAFELSVGVANIEIFADDLTTPPAYVTPSASGRGFVELADHLLFLRST